MNKLSTILFLTLAGAAPAFGDIISVQPSSLTVDTGQHFSIDLRVDGATDLAAFQLSLGFNPAVLAANSVAEGPFLPAAGPTIFLPSQIDNVAGVISFIGDVLIGGGASGSGTLATVDFTALASGSSPLTIFNVIALDSLGGNIAVTTVPGAVTVTASAVPEPASALLLLAVAGALAWRRRSSS